VLLVGGHSSYHARSFPQLWGAAILLKREDLAHTGAHKINNALGRPAGAAHGKKESSPRRARDSTAGGGYCLCHAWHGMYRLHGEEMCGGNRPTSTDEAARRRSAAGKLRQPHPERRLNEAVRTG